MADDPVAVLVDLLDRVPGVEPVVLECLGPPEGDDGDEVLDFQFRRLEAIYRDAVDEVTARWGVPVFDGTVADGDFPPWADALVAAVWRRGDAVAFLALRHTEEDGPLTLEAVALTKDEVDGMAGLPVVGEEEGGDGDGEEDGEMD
jgi:hypothetical protein